MERSASTTTAIRGSTAILTMTTTAQLKAAAEAAQETAYDDDHIAHYIGEYGGRFWHEGVAISFNREYNMTVCKMIAKHCPDLGEPDQKDNLGFDALWSWDKRKFTDGENPEESEEL